MQMPERRREICYWILGTENLRCWYLYSGGIFSEVSFEAVGVNEYLKLRAERGGQGLDPGKWLSLTGRVRVRPFMAQQKRRPDPLEEAQS